MYWGRNYRQFKLFKADVAEVIDLRQLISCIITEKTQIKTIILSDDASASYVTTIYEITKFEDKNILSIFCINAWRSGSRSVTTDKHVIDKLPRLCDKRFYFFPADLQKKVDKRIKQILKF